MGDPDTGDLTLAFFGDAGVTGRLDMTGELERPL